MRTITLLFTLLCLTLPAVAAAEPLRILLTNDDGYDQPGIRAMFDALTKAGHQVTMLAPAVNNSGGSSSITIVREIEVKQTEPNIYAVSGTPATAVMVGLGGVFVDNPPDLIVSGINEGANIGPASAFSGTVGAVVTGLRIGAIPGIAISTDPLERATRATANLTHYAEVAAFTVRLIDKLIAQRAQHDGRLLPAGIALNVNYPPLAADRVKGVKIAEHGTTMPFQVGFKRMPNGNYALQFDAATAAQPAPADAPEADTTAFRAGYIAIVPMDGEYTAPAWNSVLDERKLEALQP
jgi:5'/3'-nucleotidase SurE